MVGCGLGRVLVGVMMSGNEIISEDEYIRGFMGRIDRFCYYSCWQMLLRGVFIFIIKP